MTYGHPSRCMRLLLASEEDIAGINIRDRLLEMGGWTETTIFDGRPVRKRGNDLLASIEGSHLWADEIDGRISSSTGSGIDEVIFLSRHKAASGIPTLTVHPIGNYGKADYGGKSGELVPSAPRLMTSLLCQLKEKAQGLPFQVSFEVTHHGPWLTKPTLFIEIGSDDGQWGNRDAAIAIATSLIDAVPSDDPIAIGIGGGHYAPRFTEVCLSHRICFGHMMPSHAIDKIPPEEMAGMILKAKLASGASLAFVHKKSMGGAKAREMRSICESIGLQVVDSGDLEPRQVT